MLNEILCEFEKVREKDKSTKKYVKDLIKNLKEELINLDNELDSSQSEMMVCKI
jgi:hypothetical protein